MQVLLLTPKCETLQAKELAEKKAQKLQEMDDNLKAKMSAAEERRKKLLSETKEKAAISASPARSRSAAKDPARQREEPAPGE